MTNFTTQLEKGREELWKAMDSFLTEAKDKNGNERSLDRLNKDRQLFMENIIPIFHSIHSATLDDVLEVLPKWDDMKGTPENWEGFNSALTTSSERINSLRK